MKYRCPYCRADLPDPPPAQCPGCKKTMNLPANLRPMDARIRKQAKEKIRREADRERRSIGGPPAMGRKPGQLLIILLGMSMLGILLISQARRHAVDKPVRSPRNTVALELLNLRVALELFSRDCGEYPSSAEGLTALVRNPGTDRWAGPYVVLIKNDPWSTPYYYDTDSTNVVLFSCGPDGQPHSPDDVYPSTNWISHAVLQ